jgi:hypothetical protein
MPPTADVSLPHIVAPKPIPGGLQVRDGSQIHVWAPGPQGEQLPYTKLTMQGLHVEPSTMTDIDGFVARAYVIGKAAGSDGREYDLEVDIGPFKGIYIGADGLQHAGTFAFI